VTRPPPELVKQWDAILARHGLRREPRPSPRSAADVEHVPAAPSAGDECEKALYEWAEPRLAAALRLLPPRQRLVLLLKYSDPPWQQSEIGAALLISQSGVSKLQTKAFRAVQCLVIHADAVEG
jgi:DNA-directed RNA polymerase specialized sigma24 family protein